MKLKHFLLLPAIFIIADSYCQEDATAGSYLSFIGTQYEEMSKDMMSYSSALAHKKGTRKIEKRRNELLLQVKTSGQNIRRMKPFQGDAHLRDSIVSYFNMCHVVLSEDYGKIVNLEDIAEQSYDAMEAYLLAKDKANEKLDLASERVATQYAAFAAVNKIKLIESNSKLSQKMKEVAKVNDYYNKVFLLFFRSYKNEAYFLDGLAKGDINAMEQTKDALLTSATTDLSTIGPITGLDGDLSLKSACQQVLMFYKNETTKIFPIMIEFQLKQENFEKMKKVMESKSDKTNEEINVFNKAVADYNISVKKVNTANEEAFKNRSAALDKWNNSSENFLDSHTPKYK